MHHAVCDYPQEIPSQCCIAATVVHHVFGNVSIHRYVYYLTESNTKQSGRNSGPLYQLDHRCSRIRTANQLERCLRHTYTFMNVVTSMHQYVFDGIPNVVHYRIERQEFRTSVSYDHDGIRSSTRPETPALICSNDASVPQPQSRILLPPPSAAEIQRQYIVRPRWNSEFTEPESPTVINLNNTSVPQSSSWVLWPPVPRGVQMLRLMIATKRAFRTTHQERGSVVGFSTKLLHSTVYYHCGEQLCVDDTGMVGLTLGWLDSGPQGVTLPQSLSL
ncbi:hypothetical protein CERSUDRAFT_118703 [Gelatoporia subvermispora B]|uniref:Uncharacterized protein n=1 Tax=Ceriporiopsis subvermispora (strain B) TaxID=914234 RepID=M2QJN6_CERS8|nr:hypothetical protein CERSUDRAFT_118703 [Gelatoporia subvermispora B]